MSTHTRRLSCAPAVSDLRWGGPQNRIENFRLYNHDAAFPPTHVTGTKRYCSRLILLKVYDPGSEAIDDRQEHPILVDIKVRDGGSMHRVEIKCRRRCSGGWRIFIKTSWRINYILSLILINSPLQNVRRSVHPAALATGLLNGIYGVEGTSFALNLWGDAANHEQTKYAGWLIPHVPVTTPSRFHYLSVFLCF